MPMIKRWPIRTPIEKLHVQHASGPPCSCGHVRKRRPRLKPGEERPPQWLQELLSKQAAVLRVNGDTTFVGAGMHQAFTENA